MDLRKKIWRAQGDPSLAAIPGVGDLARTAVLRRCYLSLRERNRFQHLAELFARLSVRNRKWALKRSAAVPRPIGERCRAKRDGEGSAGNEEACPDRARRGRPHRARA